MVQGMISPRRRATYDDLRKLPERVVAEIVDGELFTSPRPASPHAYAVSLIRKCKMRVYARKGIGHPWLVYPLTIGRWWLPGLSA